MDGAFDDYETGYEEDGTMEFAGKENVTGGGQCGGDNATIVDSMGTTFNPRLEEVAHNEEENEDSVESVTKKVETLVG